jgi:hypothetical protein
MSRRGTDIGGVTSHGGSGNRTQMNDDIEIAARRYLQAGEQIVASGDCRFGAVAGSSDWRTRAFGGSQVLSRLPTPEVGLSRRRTRKSRSRR